MERNPPLPTRIEDVAVLPHPKAAILDALIFEIGQGIRNTLMTCCDLVRFPSLSISAMSAASRSRCSEQMQEICRGNWLKKSI